MGQLWMEYGKGFQLNANKGLAWATGWDETRQYIERVAFTNAKTVLPNGVQVPPEYVRSPKFGLSLRLMVGQNLAGQAAQALAAALRAASAAAPGTNPNQPPDITVTNDGHLFNVTCVVFLSNGLSGTLSYQLS